MKMSISNALKIVAVLAIIGIIVVDKCKNQDEEEYIEVDELD